MKRLKDFFYNFNDIVIVLGILAIAAFLILWRVDIIMRYPKTVAAQTVQTSQKTEDTKANDTSKDKDKKNEKSDKDKKDNDKNNFEKSTVEDGTIWKDGVLKNNMSVKVPSGTATDAVNGLVEAGLFKSYDDFAALSEQLGLDPTSIIPGTYKFDAGKSQSDIIQAVLSK
ncbi:MAG: hypothetical protein HXL98_01835 [[Eubacterium] sulci]|nr:hypothetical protein [[Eubacterium] sulci]